MELLYIWIEEYKNIKEQGFNFSSKHRFEFIPEKDKDDKIIGGKLCHEETPNHIENFFDKNIINVTAIIGENGAGKSTLIEFTRDIFVNSIFSGKPDGIICVTKRNQTDEKYKIEGYKELLESVIPISKQENIFEKYYHHKDKNTGFSLPFARTKVVINYNPPVLFYSGIYDGKREYYHSSHTVSISTNYLIENEVIRSQDILRQIIFIEENPNINIKFSLPKELVIDFNPIFIKVRMALDTENIIENYHTILSNYIPKSLIDRLCQSLLIIFIDLFESSGSFWQETLIQILKEFQEQILKENLGEVTKAILKKYKLNYDNNDLNKEIDAMLELMSILENDERSGKIQPKKHQGFSIIYDISDISNRQNVKKILKNYQIIRNNKKGTFFFIIDWRSLSSGEKMLLNLYSRFYSAVEDKNHIKPNELTILIDEGETGFHSQWQKEYLKVLIDFLPQIFPDKKIQIILTSHSPFLVSDLPKENIIFLKKNDEGKCVVSKLQDRKETFGSNIHTLFTDSFFMKGGLIGDFAQDKINEVINLLNGDIEQIEEKEDFIKKVIEMIGEPILKRQLLKMLNDKLTLSSIGLNKKIKEMEKEVEKLKGLYSKIKNDKNR